MNMEQFPGITKTPGVLGGKARLEGHRIAVVDVAELLDNGRSVVSVANGLDISEGKVRRAKQYWDEHPQEIRQQMAARDRLYDELVGQSDRSSA